MPVSTLPPLPVAVPLLGAASLAASRRWLTRAAADSIGIAFSGATLVITISLLLRSIQVPEVYWFGNWFPRGSTVVGISFVLDPIGTGLAVLASFLTLLSLLFAWRFVDTGSNHFQPLMLLFLAAMCGFTVTGDLFNLFVFFELMSTAAFALCGLKTEEPAPLQGSFNFAVTNTIAAFLVLTGIALLYSITGALNMAQIGASVAGRHDATVLFAFALLTCGFFIKAAIAPFHLWLPDAHAVAPTPVCVLFSGIMVELGLYAILRIHSVIFAAALASHVSAIREILLVFGACTVSVGGIMCYAEHHIKRLLAFSTICHAGMMLMAMAIGGPLAAAAMLTYVLAHALVKSGLFFTSGIMLHRLRSISERTLFGTGKGLPWIGLLWFLGGAGLAGAPGFATMLGEDGASRAEELAHVSGVSAAFFVGGLLTGAAVFRVGMHTFFGWGDEPITDSAAEVGELPETKPEDRRLTWWLLTPPAVCIAGAIGLTFCPAWLATLCNAAASTFSQSAYIHAVYSGRAAQLTQEVWQRADAGAVFRGSAAMVLAWALACSSVFRGRIARWMRVGPRMEGELRWLRMVQSGHPGDYVFWITVGLAVFGSASIFLLRI